MRIEASAMRGRKLTKADSKGTAPRMSIVTRVLAASLTLATATCFPPKCVPQAAAHALQYQRIDNWAQIPNGGAWGVMSAVDIDSNGDIYVFQRDDAASQTSSQIMVFDANGKFLRSWGKGEFPSAHGLRISPKHTVWVTDRKLQQAFEYDRQGKFLLTLGQKNVAGNNDSKDSFNGISDIAFGKNGDIFFSDGEGQNTRIMKFSNSGNFIKMWGTKGADPGQFNLPHSLAIDSQGRVWVCDRLNKRLQVFDQDGDYIEQFTNFGTPSAIFIAKDNKLYVADAAPENRLLIADLNGKILDTFDGLNGGHGLAVDANGAIYVAESSGKTVSKYIKKVPK